MDLMVQEAARYHDRDRMRQAVIALRNETDALLNKADRVGREAGERFGEVQREELALLARALDLSLPTGDMRQIRERMELLRQALQALAAGSVQ